MAGAPRPSPRVMRNASFILDTAWRLLLRGWTLLDVPAQGSVGHEFHYAAIVEADMRPQEAFCTIADAEGNAIGSAGHRQSRVTGTFFHAIAEG